MEQRVSVVTLGVTDLERSRRFYQDGMGWRRANTDEGVVFFQLNGIVLALFPRKELAADAGVPGDGDGFRGIALAYNTRTKEDVDAVLRQAEEAGARIVKSAQTVFWGGYSGYFADPDGHLWEVAWNPGWKIDAEGNVSMRSE